MKTQNYIAGQWTDGATTIANINPSDVSDVIGNFAQADAAQLAAAVACAQDAAAAWGEAPLEAKQAALAKIGEEMIARADELGDLLSREEGKPLAEGRGEAARAGQFFVYFAHEALRLLGITADSVRAGVTVDTRREPMGVVAVISPWNFPLATASWKIAPALAFGNAVLWKPSNQTPASACALAEIISRAGLPVGVFQLLMGAGGEVGQGLAQHEGVNAVSFTGSYTTGKQVAAACAARLAKFQLELGAKNALAVMDDADMDLAIAAAVAGAYSGSGQKCTASSRLLAHRKIYDEFADKLAAATRALRVEDARAAGTQVGPVINETQLAENREWLQRARGEGATLLCGDEPLQTQKTGHYMRPALLGDTTNDMQFNREEMFAPIAALQRVDSCAHATEVANDTHYGLTAGIVTRSLARAAHFRRHAAAGCVMVNLPTAGTDYHVPFGGYKKSGFGPREMGTTAAEFYTQIKTAYTLAGKGGE